jgi:hypothetical protein
VNRARARLAGRACHPARVAMAVAGVAACCGALACSAPAEAPLPPGSGATSASGGGPGVGGSPGVGGVPGSGGIAPQPVSPSVAGSVYSLTVGTVELQVDSAVGARVISLAAGGGELLSGAGVNATNYGSTFWTSPQSDWNWPPPAAIDSEPYAATIDGTAIRMTSGNGSSPPVNVVKVFSADAGSGWIRTEYTVSNVGTAPITLAPWEITRVPRGGLAFFPLGAGGIAANTTLTVSEAGSAAWFDSATQGGQDQKLFADGGAGWSAHAAQGFLFVKRFADVPVGGAASGEAEIEIYSGAGYVELEVQGAVGSVAAGASVTWSSEWKVVAIPPEIPVQIGSAALVELAAQVAGS